MKKFFRNLIVLCSLIPAVHALDYKNVDFSDVFANIGKAIMDTLSRDYAVFGIVVIVLIIVFRSIFIAGFTRVPHLDNKFGRNIGNALAYLCVLGIIYFKIRSGKNVHGILEDILGPSGIFAAIFITVLLFFWLRSSMGDYSLPAAGLAGFAMGSMIANNMMKTIGIIIFVLGVIYALGGRVRQHERDMTDLGIGKTDKAESDTKKEGKKKVKDQKDSVTLLEDQLKDLQKQKKVEADIKEIDSNIVHLEQIEKKLDKKEGEILDDEKKLVQKMEQSEETIKKIDQELEKDYELYNKSTDNQTHANIAERIKYLRERREYLVELHQKLSQRLSGDLELEDRVMDRKKEVTEAEQKDIDLESDKTLKGEKIQDEIIDDEIELEPKIPSNLVGKEKRIKYAEEQIIKANKHIEKMEAKISQILEKIKKQEKEIEKINDQIPNSKIKIELTKNKEVLEKEIQKDEKIRTGFEVKLGKVKQIKGIIIKNLEIEKKKEKKQVEEREYTDESLL